jgi:hypothetical protein
VWWWLRPQARLVSSCLRQQSAERNRISFGDLRRLQRNVLPHSLVTRKQAEVLIALEQTITRTDKAWAGYLVGGST